MSLLFQELSATQRSHTTVESGSDDEFWEVRSKTGSNINDSESKDENESQNENDNNVVMVSDNISATIGIEATPLTEENDLSPKSTSLLQQQQQDQQELQQQSPPPAQPKSPEQKKLKHHVDFSKW